MALSTTFTKSLGASSANSIALSQSGSAGVPLLLNGAASNYLSTTASAAVAVGGTVIPLASVTGLVPGQLITDTTAAVLATNTRVQAVGTSKVTIFPPVGGANGVGNGDTIVLPGTATIDTASASNSAPGRRVVIAYTGTDTSFVIVGTNATGNIITDTAVGASGSAVSNLDFVTVTSITPVGGGLTGVTAGTNGVGASPWFLLNWRGYAPMSVGVGIELVSGAVNFTLQYTYDDPNRLPPGVIFPLPFNSTTINAASASVDGALPNFVNGTAKAARVIINSGTGELRVRFVQAGAG